MKCVKKVNVVMKKVKVQLNMEIILVVQDCPYVSLTCPVPLYGPYKQIACSGKGICLDASDQCKCFLGM